MDILTRNLYCKCDKKTSSGFLSWCTSNGQRVHWSQCLTYPGLVSECVAEGTLPVLPTLWVSLFSNCWSGALCCSEKGIFKLFWLLLIFFFVRTSKCEVFRFVCFWSKYLMKQYTYTYWPMFVWCCVFDYFLDFCFGIWRQVLTRQPWLALNCSELSGSDYII